MHRRKLKTMKDWEREANGNCQYSWYDYAKPGDMVDESVFIYFMDVTTPRIYRDGYLQVGAPYSRVMDDEMGTERDTFPTFERVEKGIYRLPYTGGNGMQTRISADRMRAMLDKASGCFE